MHIRWSYGKYKVSIGYDTDKVPRSVEAVVNSTQLSEEVDQESQLAPAIGRVVIAPVLEQLAAQGLDTSGVVTHINPSGRFVIGGPKGDAGLTGRKIIVDTYGGMEIGRAHV